MSLRDFALRAVSGQAEGPAAATLRAATAAVEPFYALAMRLRNKAFEQRALPVHALPRPTISAGNITTGGTGKTPVVAWLARRFSQGGIKPAILLRGYRGGDEAAELADALGVSAVVAPNPDRVKAAYLAIQQNPEIGIFLLDDGMQHRRAGRDFELVIIDATQPFGFAHVLPRGLLREPLVGLRRADAFLINRCGQAGGDATKQIARKLQTIAPSIPIFRCDPTLTELRNAAGANESIKTLRGKKVLAACAIGNPENFGASLEPAVERPVALRSFDDHHRYTRQDIEQLQAQAKTGGAESIITTAKDWVKIRPLIAATDVIPIQCAVMGLSFFEDDETNLFDRIQKTVTTRRPNATLP